MHKVTHHAITVCCAKVAFLGWGLSQEPHRLKFVQCGDYVVQWSQQKKKGRDICAWLDEVSAKVGEVSLDFFSHPQMCDGLSELLFSYAGLHRSVNRSDADLKSYQSGATRPVLLTFAYQSYSEGLNRHVGRGCVYAFALSRTLFAKRHKLDCQHLLCRIYRFRSLRGRRSQMTFGACLEGPPKVASKKHRYLYRLRRLVPRAFVCVCPSGGHY